MGSQRKTTVTRAPSVGPRGQAGRDAVTSGAVVEGTSALGWHSLLADVPLFRALPKRHLQRVIELVELRRFRAGATIVREGAQGDAFYIVLDGRARVEAASGHTTMLGTGKFFGELALLDGAPRSATVSAGDVLTAGRIARPAFLRLIREEPTIAVGLARGLVAIVRDLQRA